MVCVNLNLKNYFFLLLICVLLCDINFRRFRRRFASFVSFVVFALSGIFLFVV